MQTHSYQIGGMLRLLQISRIIGFIVLAFYSLMWLLGSLGSLGALLMPADMLEEILLDSGAYAGDLAQVMEIMPIMATLIVLLTTLQVAFIMNLVSKGQLLKRNAKFLRTYETMLIVLLVGLLIFDFMLIFLMGPTIILRSLLITVAIVAAAAGFLLYAVRSVRVRTYMGSDEYIKRSIFTRNVTPPTPAVPDAQPSQHF